MAEFENLQNPYVGPFAFGTEHKDFFFGRDKEAKLLFSRAVAETVVLFYAESGAGKTSLINAHLIPSLSEKYQVLPVIRVGRDLPSEFPYDDVYNVYSFNTLRTLTTGKVKPKDLTAMTLVSLVNEELLDIDYGRPHWLIFDQFEEIVTTHLVQREKRADFFDQLRDLLEADRYLSLVLALREDHLAEVDNYAPHLPGRMSMRLRMERLNKHAANDAVRLPSERAGRTFTKAVANLLVEDLSQLRIADQKDPIAGDHVEPMHLQIVCCGLWEKLNQAAQKGEDTSQITAEHLKKYAQVDEVLENYYNDVIRNVTEKVSMTESELRRWVGDTLITPSGIRAQVNRGFLKSGNLPNKVVDLLYEAHLLRVEEARGGKWYELSHDRFISPILQSNVKWTSQGGSPLAIAAQAWVKANHEESFLLRGQKLRQAQAEYFPQVQKLSHMEREFLTTSINTENSELRRTKISYILLGVALLVFGSVGWYAFQKNQTQEKQKIEIEKEKRELEQQQAITSYLLKEFGDPTSEYVPDDVSVLVSSSPIPSPETTPTPESLPELIFKSSVVGQVRWRPSHDGIVEYLDNWDSLNIISVDIPQLRNVKGANNGKEQFNRLAAEQLKAAWAEVEAQGLLDRVITWNGSFARKFSKKNLSAHALGLAFDINYDSNRSGLVPPNSDEQGSVRELVPIFKKHGFIWGGDWNIPEGAHFEVIEIKNPG